ncbi:M48 family metalloprotease [Humisphaera borealis]|uniref:Peptidase M48 domain-containing protein n=1 Tax=Humisphaera borealis TaxID=2807512 RepID=A0A7M2WUM8_9BACT|nr:hypothetical protein [Humisphaera borealis]QOV89235.1 hypothetical protein IPV69_23985 [Humisphaera borealis]
MRYSSNVLAKMFYWVALAFVEPMRGVLWLMMLGSHLLSCHVLRRMEYDADRLEAGLAGVDDFVDTSRLLVFLGIASQRARYDLADALDNKRLADDVPALVSANARQLAEHRDDILKLVESEKTGWFDTHPSHSDRVRSVRATGGDPIVACTEPASGLFADFGGTCRQATEAFYREALGDEQWEKVRGTTQLVATADIAGDRNTHRQAAKSLRRFFRNQMAPTRPIGASLDALQPADDLAAVTAELGHARQAVLTQADQMGNAVEQYHEAAGVMSATRAQLELCGIFSFNPKAGGVLRKARARQAAQRPVFNTTSQQLAAFEEPARRRLDLALQLLGDGGVLARLPLEFDAEGAPLPSRDPRSQIEPLVRVSHALQGVQPRIDALREAAMSLEIFCPAYNPANPYQPLVNRIISVDNEVIDLLRDIRSELNEIPYPYAHGVADCTLGAALVDDIPKNDDRWRRAVVPRRPSASITTSSIEHCPR